MTTALHASLTSCLNAARDVAKVDTDAAREVSAKALRSNIVQLQQSFKQLRESLVQERSKLLEDENIRLYE
ncbi:hypothetical protein HDV05_001380, partial [Chytridiales sp. JEL 0842]